MMSYNKLKVEQLLQIMIVDNLKLLISTYYKIQKLPKIEMLNLIRNKVSRKPTCPIIPQLEQTIKQNQNFLESIQQWRNLQIKYIGQVMQLQTKLRDHIQQNMSQADNQFLKLLQIVVKNHKIMITKINQDIFEACFHNFQKILEMERNIVDEEKSYCRNLWEKKEQLVKVKQLANNFNKSMADQLIQEIFTHHSIAEGAKKEKIVQKVQKMYEKRDQQGEKVQEAMQIYCQAIQKSKQNYRRFDNHQDNFTIQAMQVVRKAANNINTFAHNIQSQTQCLYSTSAPTPQFQQSHYMKFCQQYQQILQQYSTNYLQSTLQLIKSHQLQNIIIYYKNKQIKNKIKQALETQQICFQNTDEITRQVQLMKRILRGGRRDGMSSESRIVNDQCKQQEDMNTQSESYKVETKSNQLQTQQQQQPYHPNPTFHSTPLHTTLLNQFRTIIFKTSKNRINFIFMLQLYRINSKFEMTQQQIQPILILIKQVLHISHVKKDIFVIKQMLILLLTYYVVMKDDGRKVYLLEFFKGWGIWRDIGLWEGMLVESIFSEKKATIRMLLTASVSNRDELQQAQKSLILNQILYTIRNMLVFDYSQKQVKQFVNKFVKLLFSKQDDKFMKDIYVSIESAIQEESCNKNKKDGVLKEIKDIKAFQFWKNWTYIENQC